MVSRQDDFQHVIFLSFLFDLIVLPLSVGAVLRACVSSCPRTKTNIFTVSFRFVSFHFIFFLALGQAKLALSPNLQIPSIPPPNKPLRRFVAKRLFLDDTGRDHFGLGFSSDKRTTFNITKHSLRTNKKQLAET